jgi:hypothetical protein
MIINRVETKKSKEFGLKEKDIENVIFLDPSILNLPTKVRVVAQQRRHSRAGILDLLLQSEDQETRYVVELQLGVLDETHIVRTIEYWDIERRNYPNYNHVAVIVAEGIGRFLNVIGLLAGRIPIIVINMTMFKDGSDAGLMFSTVIDQTVTYENDEPLINNPQNREKWVNEYSEEKILRIENICAKLTQNIFAPRFNIQSYIALGNKNQVTFYPQARNIVMSVLLDQSDEIDQFINENSIDTLPYDSRHRRYRVYLSIDNGSAQEEKLIKKFGDTLFPNETIEKD